MAETTQNMMILQTARRALLEKNLSTSLQNAAYAMRGSSKDSATKKMHRVHHVLEVTFLMQVNSHQLMIHF